MNNTNTKFPPLFNSSFYHHYTKHGIVRLPITIINGINKPHSETITKESYSKEIHEHYSDNTSDSIVYEEKAYNTECSFISATYRKCF
jgi:hypothetical protein